MNDITQPKNRLERAIAKYDYEATGLHQLFQKRIDVLFVDEEIEHSCDELIVDEKCPECFQKWHEDKIDFKAEQYRGGLND